MTVRTIESRQNPEIKTVYSLRKSATRKKLQTFIAEGAKVCLTLFQEGATLKTCYVTAEKWDTISDTIPENNICIVPEPVMQKISQAKTPSGILATFEIPKQPAKEKIETGIVLLDLNDPGNVGTLIRTATAMNCSTVILVNGVDPWSFKVVQSSAGYITNVNIFQLSWAELVSESDAQKLVRTALVVQSGKKPTDINNKNSLLIIGSESHGIPKELLLDCPEQITLPMPGQTESLNASVAGSIALYLLHNE